MARQGRGATLAGATAGVASQKSGLLLRGLSKVPGLGPVQKLAEARPGNMGRLLFLSVSLSLMVQVAVGGRGEGVEGRSERDHGPYSRRSRGQVRRAEQRSNGQPVVDHSLVKKYFLEMYNVALKKATAEQEAIREKTAEIDKKEEEPVDANRRRSFNGMTQTFGSPMKGKFGKEQHVGYNYGETVEDHPRSGVDAYATGVQPFGGGHKHKHHHHRHEHEHSNDHKHAHQHLHEHEEEHKHKAKHQHVHKHEHHHEHNHHHKHKEAHEHAEDHKHNHKHQHAHKGSSWRRNGEERPEEAMLPKNEAVEPKRKKNVKPRIPTHPSANFEEKIGAATISPVAWQPVPPSEFPEYQEMVQEYDWEI